MEVIRILQVFTIMNRGGAESMIMNYYRKIDRTKVQFDFLVHRKMNAAFDKEIEGLGGRIYRLDPINPFFPSPYYKKLRTFFSEHTEYSVVHSHLNTFSSFPLKIAKEFNIPYRIAHAHIAMKDFSIFDISPKKEGLRETLKKLVKIQLRKRIGLYTTHYFSCGEKAGQWLFGKNASFEVMNNAIDSENFVFDESVSDSYREQFNLVGKLVIGHVGRFSTQKNHIFLLKIFKQLVQRNRDYRLVLVGDGSLKKSMEEEAKKMGIDTKVLFLGSRADMSQLYQMMDIFVFPSLYEGLPVTLVEAQAAGLKILASDTITKEVNITNDIEFLSINKTADFWAQKITETGTVQKNDNQKQIIDQGFDIEENSRKITNFYLQQTIG